MAARADPMASRSRAPRTLTSRTPLAKVTGAMPRANPSLPSRVVVSARARTGLLLFFLICGLPAARASTTVLDVWPGSPPVVMRSPGPEVSVPGPSGMVLPKQVRNVSRPTLTVFSPDPRMNTGVGIVVCPGGGFKDLETEKEGEEAARWANSLGMVAFVLQYRVPAPTGYPEYFAALQDVQRAMSLIRSRAPVWHLHPDRIGIMGFSAGANLAARAGLDYDRRTYATIDPTDAVSCRPDFAIVIYPGGLLEPGSDQLDPALVATASAPPMFIVDAEMDRVNSDNSTLLFLALKRAGAPAELHIYQAGVHGFGLRPTANPHGTWPRRCADWMMAAGLLPRPR